MAYIPSIFLIVSIFVSSSFGQQLISLNTFKGGNVLNDLKLTGPCSIYISANDDDDMVLRQVIITSGNTKISLYDLKTRRLPQNSGQLQPYSIQPATYLTTTLSTDQLAPLTGVMYLSSLEQLQSNAFFVIDINAAQNFDIRGLGAVDTTVLFLNTNGKLNPARSSLISNWQQDGWALANFYAGVPYGAIEPKNTQIFSNPMRIGLVDTYFSNVEKFSFSLVAFYLKTYKGCAFRIEPGSAPIAGTYTTAYTTTGFYMKPLGTPDAAITVNMMRDTRYGGYTGSNILGYLPTDGSSVSFAVYDGSNQYSQTTVPTDFFAPWSTPHIGNNFVIFSNNARNGQYYVQYFVIQSSNANVTTSIPNNPTPKPTSPGKIETTTKATGALFPGFLMMASVVVAKLI